MDEIEFVLHSADNAASVLSPLSGLAAAFSSQSLETPRRRLSLDTNSSSGTPGHTPDLAMIVEATTPDTSCLSETSPGDPPITVAIEDGCSGQQSETSTGSSKCMTISVPVAQTVCDTWGSGVKSVRSLMVPSLVFSSFQSASRSSSGSSGDLRTPGVMISPAPSPVFAPDEDSRDSGYDGDIPAAIAPASTAANGDLFLHPRAKVTKSQTSTSFKVFDDGFDITEDDEIFEDAMHVDDPVDTPPGRMAPIASLLQKRILYEGDRKAPTETNTSESYHGTPLKRKQSGRLTRFGYDRQQKLPRNDTATKRSNNQENSDDESRDKFLDPNGQSSFKRRKSLVETGFTALRAPLKLLNRSHSEADAFFAVHKDDSCHLIGDQSMPHALPIMDRPHINDLKCISSDTLRRLMSGEFDSIVHSYTLVDCRYPYEYEGGHIRGAVNVYTQEDLACRLLEESVIAAAATSLEQAKRQIFVFYCEFSRERGPRMTRFLRKRDRQLNEHHYPKLYYPEIYLLDGGYKNFFSSCKELCEPQTYRPMHDENHVNELRKFRSKSKSWCSSGGDVEGVQSRRPGLNRGLFSSKGY